MIIWRLFSIASSFHYLLAGYDHGLCVSDEGRIPFFILRLIALFSKPPYEYLQAELCQCLHCCLSLVTSTTHNLRKPCSVANMLALDARCLFNILLHIQQYPALREFGKKLEGILLDWGDLDARRRGRGVPTKEGINAGVYDGQLMEIVQHFMEFNTTVSGQ